ncbi:MAG: AsmA family protein [Bacteroidia bacterium]|nr:AsmA family protein [Methylotenera sp.]
MNEKASPLMPESATQALVTQAPSAKLSINRRWLYMLGGLFMVLVAGVAVGEYLGWPFLAGPLARELTAKLERRVSFSANENAESKVSIRFLGGLRLNSPLLEIAAPSWSKAPHLLLANDVVLELRYIDIWRAYRDEPLRIKRLQANSLDAHLERLTDGRASWQFGKKSTSNNPVAIPTFGRLQVNKGVLSYKDVPLQTSIDADFSLVNGEHSDSKADAIDTSANTFLKANATGYYHKLPLKFELVSSGTVSTKTISTKTASPKIAPMTQNSADHSDKVSQAIDAKNIAIKQLDSNGSDIKDKVESIPITLDLKAKVGRAALTFKGTAANALNMTDFAGHFDLKGPSMAAVGDLFGVTLPTTAEFNTGGLINKQGGVWRVKVDNLDIGASHLNGDFRYATSTYDADKSIPLLSGTLGGSKLLLTDLGPAFGTVPSAVKRVKMLPTRPFDLASLRAMDADISVDIKYVDLNTSFLEPLRPLRGHLQLKSGILSLRDLDARTAEGRLWGNLSLDGRGSKALWDSNLRWDGVKLERWVKQVRDDGLPPYISGRLNGQAVLKGQGISTAEILATLSGNIRSELQDGAVSHFVIEVAGLDLAQAMGVLFKGDESLPVQCGIFDLIAKEGVFRPHVMVVDTKDSAVWVDGSLSLATEALNLRAIVMPKDFSPLTLRAPLQIRGSFANPEVSLEKQPIGIKLASSLFLGLLNPLAALIPLFDNGDTKEAKSRAAGCEALMHRSLNKPLTAQ